MCACTGNLSMPHATKKVKVLEPSLTATLHSSSSLFHLPQSDHTIYLLSMSITLFYLHSARKHYKNMSFTGHMLTRIEHETFAKWLQPCATHSSGIVQPLVGIVTSGPQVCSSLPPKIGKPQKKHSNHFNHISYHHFKEEMTLCIESKIHSKVVHKYSAVRTMSTIACSNFTSSAAVMLLFFKSA